VEERLLDWVHWAVAEFKFDGFRFDAAKHVSQSFWKKLKVGLVLRIPWQSIRSEKVLASEQRLLTVFEVALLDTLQTCFAAC
jgi:glycosidase